MKSKKPNEITDVIATAIQCDRATILITRTGKFYLREGRVMRVEPIDDYKSAVEKEIDAIKERASSGLFTDNYSIQLYGKMPDRNSPLR